MWSSHCFLQVTHHLFSLSTTTVSPLCCVNYYSKQNTNIIPSFFSGASRRRRWEQPRLFFDGEVSRIENIALCFSQAFTHPFLLLSTATVSDTRAAFELFYTSQRMRWCFVGRCFFRPLMLGLVFVVVCSLGVPFSLCLYNGVCHCNSLSRLNNKVRITYANQRFLDS